MAVTSKQRLALMAKFTEARFRSAATQEERYGYVALLSAVPCDTNPMAQPRELPFPGYARQRVPVFVVPGTDIWLHRDWTTFSFEVPKYGVTVTHMALFDAPEQGERLIPLDIALARTFTLMPGDSLNVPGIRLNNV